MTWIFGNAKVKVGLEDRTLMGRREAIGAGALSPKWQGVNEHQLNDALCNLTPGSSVSVA